MKSARNTSGAGPGAPASRRPALVSAALALVGLLLVWGMLGRWYGERLIALHRSSVLAGTQSSASPVP